MDWRVNERELGINLAEIDVTPATGVPWSMGLYCDKKVEQPICLEIDPDSGDVMPDAFLVGIPLFSEKLLAILNKGKVDNIQLYRVEIADKRTSTTFILVRILKNPSILRDQVRLSCISRSWF